MLRSRPMPKKKRAAKPKGYQDIFKGYRRWPLKLLDGTSIEFPEDWTPERAAAWREAYGLTKPQDVDRPRPKAVQSPPVKKRKRKPKTR